VFTARYGLIPYMKHVTFRRLKVNPWSAIMAWKQLERTAVRIQRECPKSFCLEVTGETLDRPHLTITSLWVVDRSHVCDHDAGSLYVTSFTSKIINLFTTHSFQVWYRCVLCVGVSAVRSVLLSRYGDAKSNTLCRKFGNRFIFCTYVYQIPWTFLCDLAMLISRVWRSWGGGGGGNEICKKLASRHLHCNPASLARTGATNCALLLSPNKKQYRRLDTVTFCWFLVVLCVWKMAHWIINQNVSLIKRADCKFGALSYF
jgi:hypothetical protein